MQHDERMLAWESLSNEGLQNHRQWCRLPGGIFLSRRMLKEVCRERIVCSTLFNRFFGLDDFQKRR
jgi:hypothetical protein